MTTPEAVNVISRAQLAHWLRDCRTRYHCAHGAEGRQLARLLRLQCGIS